MSLLLAAALALGAPPLPRLGFAPVCTRQVPPLAAPSGWSEPLDRIVSFRVIDLSLREALDRLSAAAHVRISYSSESIQLDRIVCVALDSVPVGDVLATLLEGAGVEPVPAGGDHVVLSPVTVAVATFPALPPVVLDRLVVTGSPAGSAWKPLAVALNDVDGEVLAARSAGTLTEVFNASVPGLWMWEQSGTSVLARYGSIRGASSFGLSYPKVYVDGIQVANPLLLTQVSPEAIERIEVIRGPQGAALYGADAISGVANIVMRHAGIGSGGPHVRLRTGLGLASSAFGSNPSVGQDHLLSFGAGSNTRSLGVTLQAGGTGEYIPGAFRRQFTGSSTGRLVGSRTIATGTLRFSGEQVGSPLSPLLPPKLRTTEALRASATGQSVTQYTAGTNVKFAQTDRIIHTLVLGLDGYTLDGVLADDRIPIPSAADAALVAARGGANRATVHVGSVAKLVRAPAATADLSFVGEHSILYQWNGGRPGVPAGPWLSRANTGGSGQLNLGLADQLFLTGGIRFEREYQNARVATLPMLGASWVIEDGIFAMKFRAAYGRGIRWPETALMEAMFRADHALPAPPDLDPEQQSGVEGGVDVMIGRAVTLQATRFDQTASGLIQRVVVSAYAVVTNVTGEQRYKPVVVGYQLQNVGTIKNRGWEFQGTLRGGALSLSGTLSLADSRVRGLKTGYLGELRVGDRLLDVPAVTTSATATLATPLFGASVTAYRASDWIGYDRLLLAQRAANIAGTDGSIPDLVGPKLRDFWTTYWGVTHLNATLTRGFRRGLSVTLNADNLLNRQRGEPDNITILPGRTFSLGFRAEF